ncbi:ATP-binding protein [Treponema primitia]|uniref:AAA family ATPase n=1 Tax=Treponema primitia TaxID=88058 RepID=UPI003980BC02
MASAAQMKSLLNSHYIGDEEHFNTVALQIAATEARQGHQKLADEVKNLVDHAKSGRIKKQTIPFNRPSEELKGLLSVSYPEKRISDIILTDQLRKKIDRIILEYRHIESITQHGLIPKRKLIMIGPPGTGKTMTASVLAGELGLPLFQVRLDGLISRYMGETASKLRLIFDSIENTLGVFFFDEFDAIGAERGLANDVGEARRILNSFLQMVEETGSNSLILAATNHPEILDTALFRRFDDVLVYELPDMVHIESLLRERLSTYAPLNFNWQGLVTASEGLSYAEITNAANEMIKTAIIGKSKSIDFEIAKDSLAERQEMKKQLNLTFRA